MSHKPAEILADITNLVKTLPNAPADYAGITTRKRRAIQAALEGAIMRLNEVAEALDLISQPKYVFDPTSAKVIGELVANTLLLQKKEPLSAVIERPFYGAGVYAFYYHGTFDCYAPIASKDHPIYVGKSDPNAMHALTAAAQGQKLFKRIKDHWSRSITKASNLDRVDFDCRYLVVKSAWVGTAENFLIETFQPVWNDETNVCYGFGKHGDSPETRKHGRSPWDTLHPGRPWATSEANKPNKKSIAEIRADIAEHFKKYPPRN